MKKNIFGIVVAIVICGLFGAVGAIFTTPNIAPWYNGLAKGPLGPPNWVFGPVWTTLFVLMAVAAFLVWRKRGAKPIGGALAVFVVQLVLNSFWSFLFFAAHSPAAAAIEIVALWFAVGLTIIDFYKISRPAAYLLTPYLLWISFAIYLNYSVVILN